MTAHDDIAIAGENMQEETTVHRMQNLGEWEFYEIVKSRSITKVCTVGMRYYSDSRQVEYGIWTTGDEVCATGSVDLSERDEWSKMEREFFIRKVLSHQPELRNAATE